MEQLRYDGQVAIVTGAGRGLGRSYARILAARGAKVIVNDLGGSTTGGGKSSDLAEAVVGDIMALGGEAIADAGDVTDPSTAQRLVALALDRWGRVDIVINNAGSIAPDVTQSFAEMELAQFDHQMQIHAYAPSISYTPHGQRCCVNSTGASSAHCRIRCSGWVEAPESATRWQRWR